MIKDESQKVDYKNTLNLPKTNFPMKADLPKREPLFYDQWEKNHLYEAILKRYSTSPTFILHDGPPYANGDIHIGHALNKILKDIIMRYKTMKGYRVPYVPGWDCHGLPVELQLFKELGKTKHDVDQIEFREKAREYALKYVKIQREQFKRLGILGDWDNPYLTMNYDYQATIMECFLKLYEKGYIFKGLKPIHWCPSCETALAEAEVEYETKSTPSIYVKFALTEASRKKLDLPCNTAILIWTTTPWTLPGNVAVALHSEAEYSVLEINGEHLIAASRLLSQLQELMGWNTPTVIKTLKGDEFERLECQHPFMNRTSLIILGSHVTLDQGTGCVHTAPGHGQEDYEIGLHYELPILSPVNEKGLFTEDVKLFEKQFVFKANQPICDLLKEKGFLVFQTKLEHSYPHCWRCKSPIIFRATKQWFLGVDRHDLRKRSLDAIEKITWIPAAGKNRIASMVEGRPDWCLSRQRLWGVPIPIFYCDHCESEFFDRPTSERVVEEVKKHGASIWFKSDSKEFMAQGQKCKVCGGVNFSKEMDIIDVWFDSGVSHHAVLKSSSALVYPADLYLEGSDQHRGWFQTSLLAAMSLTDEAPYKAVLTHGFVVDGEGKKMSKSAGNVIRPQDVMKDYGADILRLWVSSTDFSQDVRMSKEILAQIADSYRKIRNTFRYILGNLYDYDKKTHTIHLKDLNEMDRWALSRMSHIHEQVTEAYENYDFCKIYHIVDQFCTVELSSFYFDILKDRLYTFSAHSKRRQEAQSVLYEILRVLNGILSPIMVYTMEEVWKSVHEENSENLSQGRPEGRHFQDFNSPLAGSEVCTSDPKGASSRKYYGKGNHGLTSVASAVSIHLTSWPRVEESWGDLKLEERWGFIKEIRTEVLRVLELLRKDKVIGSALEARVEILTDNNEVFKVLNGLEEDLKSIFIVSQATVQLASCPWTEGHFKALNVKGMAIVVGKALGDKCQRCWNYSPSVGQNQEHPSICSRCVDFLKESY